MRRDWDAIWLIARREFRDQFRDWRILFPLIILVTAFPFVADEMTRQAVSFMNRFGGQLILDRLVPFAVLVIGFFPLSFTLLVALESFVGEKERGTIEPLLCSPLEDTHMYLGKLLVGVTTPLAFSYGSIAIYLMLISRRAVAMPSPYLLSLILFLTFAHAVLMVSSAIVISVQSTSVRAANLLASFVVVPVAFLLQGETTLIFWGNEDVLWLAILAVTILTGLIIRLGLSHFRREYMLGREIDTLNLRWMWKIFRSTFIGDAKSLGQWYRIEIPRTLRKLRTALILVSAIALIAGFASYLWVVVRVPQFVDLTPERVEVIQKYVARNLPNISSLGEELPAHVLFWHNIRASLAIFTLGFVSFATLGLCLYLFNIVLVGGVLGIAKLAGFSPLLAFATGILPHGVFELTAIILSTAAMFHLGVVLVTPQTEKSLGEVLITSLAVWARIFLGLTVPLLAIAAVVEIYITPQILLRYF